MEILCMSHLDITRSLIDSLALLLAPSLAPTVGTHLDRVRVLARLRIRLFVVLYRGDQEPDVGRDRGVV